MVKRNCKDCPVPNCGAKYLVRLANHLADVHLLDIDQRRKYLQEAKRQPKVKCDEYQSDMKTRDYHLGKKAKTTDCIVHKSATIAYNTKGKSWLTFDDNSCNNNSQ